MKIKLTSIYYGKKRFLFGLINVLLILLLGSTDALGSPTPIAFSKDSNIFIVSDKTITVDEVFELIKKQTDFTFIYKSDLFKDAPKVSLKKGRISPEALLKKSLSYGNFKYEITNDNIIVISKINNPEEQQEKLHISGIVTNVKGEPLPGVNIIENGTSNGTITDTNGKYTITVHNNATLVFSFIGYQTQYVKVNGDSEINVTLPEAVVELDEIVSTGYQRILKKNITGAAENIDKMYFENSYTPTLQEGLQGSIAGLQILVNNNHPQAVPEVIIRGVGSAFQDGVGYVSIGSTKTVLEDPISLTAGSPLYVIDGVPTTDGKDLTSINGNDIKSITVLKDAAAASIYGARGANGVIVIETKSGTTGEPKVTFSTQVGFSEFTSLNERLNTEELQELYIEGLINNTTNGIDTEEDALNFLLNPGGRTNPFNPEQNTDWADVLTRTSMMNQYNLSISGGQKDNRYYMSVGYLKNETPVQDIDFDRLSVRIKYDTKVSEKFNISTNMSYGNTMSENYETGTSFYNPFRNMYLMRPDLKVYNDDGTYNTSINYGINPLGVLTDEKRELRTNDFRGYINMKYEFITGLTLEPSFSADYKLVENYNYFPDYLGKGLLNRSSYAIQKNTNTFIWDSRVLLRYITMLGKDHRINTYLGIENVADDIKITNVSVDEMRAGAETLDNGEPVDAYTKRLQTALSSFFFNADYSYKDKYFINATFRRDGSSKFGPNNRYGNFYAFGISWNIYRETFLKDIRAINFLKLRASYGVNGNDQIGSFNYVGTFSGTEFYNGENAATIASAGNASLGWEDNATFDIGVDYAFFGNRVSGTIDFYNRKTDNLLYNVGISSFNGDNYVFENFGGMRNRGLEISINTKNIITKDNSFIWTTGFNFTTNNNEITELAEDEIISGYYIRKEGEDFNTLYLYGYAGVDPETGVELYYTDETETATTTNSREAEKYSHGKTTPDFYGSLINTFTYKNISLMAQLYTSWGGQIFESTGYIQNDNGYMRLYDYSNTSKYVYDNRWQKPGDITDVPKYVYGNSRSETRSSRWLHDGSFIRLKRIELSYNFSHKLLNKTFVKDLRLFVSADNLWTYTKDDTLENDPEIGGLTGNANFDAPLAKTVYFGLNVTF
ncbi:MAG: SusC/RagA family TonB-linked outer membrane protein [Chlorobi bacterium]|nr:SusC/RagA family TonB-linked outer membrane protein [Chlorobiota bacterium]